MAASGYTPISLYYSTTASATPLAANLANGELAINITDGKLFYKDDVGTVQTIANKNSTGTVTSVAQSFTGGLISVSGSPVTTSGTLALTVAGTSGGIPYFSSASTWATSAALAANALVIGGGAGAAPATTTTGTGVVTALGIAVGSSGAFTTNNAANTFTATQTFNGTSATKATQLLNAAETVNVVAAAPSATTNFYVNSGAVQYYTTNAANNWTLNVAFSSGTSLNTAMSVGDSITIALLTTQGTTAYYQSALTIDGASVTPKYQGGTAWSAGNASGIDAYVLTIVKTASATYTVIASQTQFK